MANVETPPPPDRLPVHTPPTTTTPPPQPNADAIPRATVKHKVSGRVQGGASGSRAEYVPRHRRGVTFVADDDVVVSGSFAYIHLAVQQVCCARIPYTFISVRRPQTPPRTRTASTPTVVCTRADDDVLMIGCHANRTARRRRRRRRRLPARPTKWMCTSSYR